MANIGPFWLSVNYILLCVIASKALAMEGPLYKIKDELLMSREQEEEALKEFTLSKNKLLEIKRKIKRLEELLKPNLS